MAKKVNPFLAAYEAKLEAEYKARLMKNHEIDMIAMLIACNNLGMVGPGHSGDLINEWLAEKQEVADSILSDSKDLEYTRIRITDRLKEILGEHWEEHKDKFPIALED